ncbi:SLC13 family permease [Aeromicrobium sp.]|uniref:SLC13 family permease n=1 Tax=Aeromicrobium sp. TaxID=1871063 RepID=UPI003D6C29EA
MSHDFFSLTAIVGFLVAMMILARACADEGLFEAWGAVVARSTIAAPVRRLVFAVVLAAVVTAALTLHATALLLAPVLLLAARRARRATALAAVRVANTGSILLPVSNITNLLAFAATGLAFVQFAWLMLPAWAVGVAAELAVVRFWFRRDLADDPAPDVVEAPSVPLFPSAVVVVVVLGLASGAELWVPAAAGAILLGGYALVRGTTTWRDLYEAANLPLAALVLVWALVVVWLGGTQAADGIDDYVPSGDGLVALVVTALVAMVAANLINNMPAALLLLPVAAAAGPVNVLALLIGLNVGANLTAIGSLANLLWRRSIPRDVASWFTFHAAGLVTTPVVVVLCTTALWGWTSLVR